MLHVDELAGLGLLPAMGPVVGTATTSPLQAYLQQQLEERKAKLAPKVPAKLAPPPPPLEPEERPVIKALAVVGAAALTWHGVTWARKRGWL